ncbi:MAG: hypothetical protein KKF46_04295 [Nanoarchaeota archaeon]|nr:hypothetical protein [Nanoarchaeota archaeon]MBU1321556.1 hypothetical protein [Nanoarchaeota archaeon]MBU1597090.1 hypothetical protein [Nanoarchaeota archaeon]MBU2441871.1 hypothetical protein [Nanoarchaeota archaeon]
MKKGFIVFLVFLFLLPAVLGATIHGKVFDYSLRGVENSVVTISTVPEQVVVSTDGTYSFNVANGNYKISAVLKDENNNIVFFVKDNISIIDDGDYVKDLILFPYEQLDELDLEDDFEQDLKEEDSKTDEQIPTGTRILISIGLIIILAAIIWLSVKDKVKKKKSKPINTDLPDEIDDLSGLLAFIKKHKRVTQKDIRKQFPMSEAKISLMISDLESQGKIKKIKKGRGNIVVFIKD